MINFQFFPRTLAQQIYLFLNISVLNVQQKYYLYLCTLFYYTPFSQSLFVQCMFACFYLYVFRFREAISIDIL